MAKTPEILSLAPTQQILTSGSGTYTTPAGVKWRVRMVGGGAGGPHCGKPQTYFKSKRNLIN